MIRCIRHGMAGSEHLVGIWLCCEDFQNSNFFPGFLAAAEAEREPDEAADAGNIERFWPPVLWGGGTVQRPFGLAVVLRGGAEASGHRHAVRLSQRRKLVGCCEVLKNPNLSGMSRSCGKGAGARRGGRCGKH